MPKKVKWVISIPSVVASEGMEELRKEIQSATGKHLKCYKVHFHLFLHEFAGTNETVEVVELSPGHSDDKYDVADIEIEADGLTYKMEMTIYNLSTQDHYDSYYLEVENSCGKEHFYFSLDIEGQN